jgi:hypothetical protein
MPTYVFTHTHMQPHCKYLFLLLLLLLLCAGGLGEIKVIRPPPLHKDRCICVNNIAPYTTHAPVHCTLHIHTSGYTWKGSTVGSSVPRCTGGALGLLCSIVPPWGLCVRV